MRTAERAWLWCKRKPAVAGLAAAVLLAVLGGTTGVLAVQARANSNLRLERDRAIAAEAKTKAINEFLTEDLLTKAEPPKDAEEDHVTLIEVLDRAAEKVGSRFANQPELELALRSTIGKTYHGLASWAKAETQARALVEAVRKRDPQSAEFYEAQNNLVDILRHRGHLTAEVLEMAATAAAEVERKLGPDDPSTLAGMYGLAQAYQDVGQFDRALPLFQETLKRKKATIGPDHFETLGIMNGLAEFYVAAGKSDMALPLYEEAFKVGKSKLGPVHYVTLTAMQGLARRYKADGRLALAIPLLEEALTHRKALDGFDSPSTLACMSTLAQAFQDAGRLDRAMSLYEETINLSKARHGPGDAITLGNMNNLAMFYYATGKLDLAQQLMKETLDLQKARSGPDHPTTLIYTGNLARVYRDAGRLDLALPLLEETLKLQRARIGPDHQETLRTQGNLAGTYWSLHQLDKSIPLYEQTLKAREANLGRGHPDTQNAVASLGVNYKDAGRLAEAIPLLEEAHRKSPKSPEFRWASAQLAGAYSKAGEHAKLADLLREQLTEARKSLPKESPQLAGLLAQIGMGMLEQKNWAEAEPLLRECLAIREKKESEDWRTFNTKSMLGALLLGQKKYADAEPLLVAGYNGLKQREKTIPPQGQTRLPEALERLVQFYEATHKPDDAAKWRKELEARKRPIHGQPP